MINAFYSIYDWSLIPSSYDSRIWLPKFYIKTDKYIDEYISMFSTRFCECKIHSTFSELDSQNHHCILNKDKIKDKNDHSKHINVYSFTILCDISTLPVFNSNGVVEIMSPILTEIITKDLSLQSNSNIISNFLYNAYYTVTNYFNSSIYDI